MSHFFADSLIAFDFDPSAGSGQALITFYRACLEPVEGTIYRSFFDLAPILGMYHVDIDIHVTNVVINHHAQSKKTP